MPRIKGRAKGDPATQHIYTADELESDDDTRGTYKPISNGPAGPAQKIAVVANVKAAFHCLGSSGLLNNELPIVQPRQRQQHSSGASALAAAFVLQACNSSRQWPPVQPGKSQKRPRRARPATHADAGARSAKTWQLGSSQQTNIEAAAAAAAKPGPTGFVGRSWSSSCDADASAPPQYKVIRQNVYLRQCQLLAPEELPVCSCRPAQGQRCGPDDNCLNRELLCECHPSTCPAGQDCQNQRLQRAQWPPSRLQYLGAKGWGLLAAAPLPAGTLVAEYVGEVLGSEQARTRAAGYEAAGLRHTYLMTLSACETIDATYKGGLARFINHSCDPNCCVEKWQVAGLLRMALVTRRAVAAGEELSYDYNLQFDGGCGRLVRCCCGAAACQGQLGAGSFAEALALQQARRAEWQPGHDGELRAVDQFLDSLDSD